MIVSNRVRIVPSLLQSILQITRNYATPRPLPVEWIRPSEIPCISPIKSGDMGLKFDIPPEEPLKNFEKSKELPKASELVKKSFSVGFNRRKDLIRLQKEKAIKLVQRHAYDRGSKEAYFGQMTIEILQLQELMFSEEFKRDKKTKVFLKELIEKRRKMLHVIRKQDYACFEYLLENLNLKFWSYPETNPYIWRKPCTKRYLEEKCEEIRKEKLNAYKAELESQLKDFFLEKAEKLQFIRNEEIACGVTPTVTEEEIEAAKKRASQYV